MICVETRRMIAHRRSKEALARTRCRRALAQERHGQSCLFASFRETRACAKAEAIEIIEMSESV